jgi:predicted ABC-type ATPase
MKADGYRVRLLFLWLPNAEMAVHRVSIRVKQGGHGIPAEDIRRRYILGLRNLFQLYIPLVDGWWLYNASHLPPTLIASNQQNTLTVIQKRLYRRLERGLDQIHEEEN